MSFQVRASGNAKQQLASIYNTHPSPTKVTEAMNAIDCALEVNPISKGCKSQNFRDWRWIAKVIEGSQVLVCWYSIGSSYRGNSEVVIEECDLVDGPVFATL